MSQPKVVALNVPQTRRSQLPPIVSSVRQQAKRELTRLLNGLFDCTDDALFEMADRARDEMAQHMYFDSMRRIRLHRAEVHKQFLREVYAGFEQAFRGPAGSEDPDEGESPKLDLVGNEELEVSVAVSGIVSKITSRFSLPIMELTKRFDQLNKTREISELSNPLGPHRLSEAFSAAIEQLDVDIKVRIILLKLFERLVMEQLGPLYQMVNEQLSEAGILPDLRRTLGKGRTGTTSIANQKPGTSGQDASSGGAATARGDARGAAATPRGSASYGQPGGGAAGGVATYSFGVIQNLLASLRLAGAAPPTLPGPELDTSQLLNVLESAQQEITGSGVDIESVPPVVDLRQVVVTRAPDVTGQAMNSLGRADDDVVNFIGMLFDYILNDRNLAIPMKALIARLQIPIVKLAIIDKTFFEKSGHPARQLLNELSSAGIGWSASPELKRDATYNKIESVVLQVLNGFSSDPDVFQTLLEDLRRFQQVERQRSKRLEDRVRQTEAGKARTQAAKLAAQKVINQKACGLRLPKLGGRLLSEVWSKLLIYAYLKNGTQSEVWQRHVRTLDDLLWSLQPLTSLDDVERREGQVPDLLQRIGEGMSDLKMTDAEREQWLKQLASQLAHVSRNDRAYLEDDADPTPDRDLEPMEEIVLTSAEELTPQDIENAAKPEFVEKIKSLKEGVWVELSQPDSEVLRCKLATIVRPGERYVFVNRRGMKVAERTRMQLAKELQDDKLALLNDSQVFDRALQAVIGNLRQMHDKD